MVRYAQRWGLLGFLVLGSGACTDHPDGNDSTGATTAAPSTLSGTHSATDTDSSSVTVTGAGSPSATSNNSTGGASSEATSSSASPTSSTSSAVTNAAASTSGGGAAPTGGTTASGAGGSENPTEPWSPTFETLVLESEFFSEGADVGDINGDGLVDLVAGPRWYKAPDFELGGTLFDAPSFAVDQYSTFFLTFVDDVDEDGDADVIAIGDAGGGNGSGNPNAHWYENPGPDALAEDWDKHVLFDGLVSNESPHYTDLLGDPARELIFMTDGELGYAAPGADPSEPWLFTPLSAEEFDTPYVHGLGVGDINGDGRFDIVEATGWWEQPATDASPWTHHDVDFAQGSRGGAQMLIYDVDGDADADVVTSLNAHGYGLSWFEQASDSSFAPHAILPASADTANVSQLHALALGDLNGDDLPDLVTGKRYYAHPSTNPDPGTLDPPVLLWFELVREGGVTFEPHEIHAESGVGCNFRIVDVDANGRPDVFVSNKHGVFLHRQQ